MAVRITSKMPNFRRCGMAHPTEPTTYPDDKFSAAELKQLQEEPMLIVDVIPEKEKAKSDAPAAAKGKSGNRGKIDNQDKPDGKTSADAQDGNEQSPVDGNAAVEGSNQGDNPSAAQAGKE